VHFIFLVDLLNFSFWSQEPGESRFAIEYRGRKWTGYWSLVAALRRAVDDNIPIINPSLWASDVELSDNVWRDLFQSATHGNIPLFKERLACIREAGKVLEDVNVS